MRSPLARATLREKAQVTLPASVREALHIEPGDELEFEIDPESGIIYITGLKTVRADQAWFWTEEWQRREAEASQEYAEGATEVFKSAEEFLDSLSD